MDTTSGQTRKVNGMRRAAATSGTFLSFARRFAVQIARDNGGFVSADEVRAKCDAENLYPASDNAWGSLFKRAPEGYRFIPTDAFKASVIPSAHGRMVRVWSVEKEVAA